MALMLDTGALISFERGDRAVAALVEAARRRRDPLLTSAGCVAQAWRGAAGQALLARLLNGTKECGLEPDVSRKVGVLLAASGQSDVIDAHVAMLTGDADTVVTSDPDDLAILLEALGSAARVRAC